MTSKLIQMQLLDSYSKVITRNGNASASMESKLIDLCKLMKKNAQSFKQARKEHPKEIFDLYKNSMEEIRYAC